MWAKGNKKTAKPGHSSAADKSRDIVAMQFKVPVTQRIPFLHGLHNKTVQRMLAVLAALVLLGGMVLAIRYYQSQSAVAVKVGNYTLSQRKYNQLLNEASKVNVNKSEAHRGIVAALASRAAADEIKIDFKLEDAELIMNARQQYELDSESPVSEFQKMMVTPTVVSKYVELHDVGGYQAAIIEFPFSRYIFGSPTDKVDTNKVGNIEEISSDVSYAEQQYKMYQDIIDQKQMAPQEIVDKVKADSRLIYGQATNPSEVKFIPNPGAEADQENELELSIWQDVTAAAEQLNKARITDVTTTYLPEDLGVASLNLKSGEGTRIGWRLTYVIKKIDEQQGTAQKYQTLIKEYSGD